MNTRILSGKEPAANILESLSEDVQQLQPTLVIIQVGSEPASNSYIRQKIQSCERIGLQYEHKKLPDTTSFEQMSAVIHALNSDPEVTGLIIQLPLPEQLQNTLPQLIKQIDPKKDVDGFGAYNLGKMFLSPEFEHLPPATPAGVIALLEHYAIPIEGQTIAVIGHSNIVGKPLAVMLLNRNATVLCTHKYTKNVSEFTQKADIVCTAVGKFGVLTPTMVSSAATIIDIGFNTTNTGISGDCDYKEFLGNVAAITPVPGGIGPMTVACLLRNVVTAKKRQLALIA